MRPAGAAPSRRTERTTGRPRSYHLARQFRAATGETIARYVTRLRLARALDRIAAGEDDLARLAHDVGFAHHSHLSSRFRALFSLTPSQVRTIVTAPRATEA